MRARMFLLTLLVPAALSAQTRPDSMPSVDDAIYGLAVDPNAHRGTDYVYLLDDGRVTVEADGRWKHTIRQVVQILTNDGAAGWGEFTLSYHPDRETVTINWMRVLRDGAIVQDGPEHVQESSGRVDVDAPVYSDAQLLRTTLAGVAPGTIVDYSVTTEVHDPVLAGDLLYSWLVEVGVPVMRSRLVLDTPSDLTLSVQERLLDFAVHDSAAGDRRIRTWLRQDVPAVEWERFAASSADLLMRIRVAGTVSWDDIATWYAALAADRYVLTAEVIQAFDSELRDAETLDDSVRAAYRWVTQEFRYVSLALGDGGYRPRAPAEVYRTRFGDCKDMATLFIALVRRMGLDAYPVLVSLEGSVDSLLPSLGQFDHVIAAVERKSGPAYFDLTTGLVPYGSLPPILEGGVGLAVPEQGGGRLAVLPLSDVGDNRWREHIGGRLSPDGTFTGSITVSASGTEQYGLRSRLLDFGERDRSEQEDLLREIAGTWEGAAIDSFLVSDGRDLATDPEVVVWLTAADAVGSSGELYTMSLPIVHFGSPDLAASLASQPGRRFPIDVASVNSPSIWRSAFEVELPDGWRVEVPPRVSVEGPFGYYRAEYRQVGRSFRASREMGGRRGTLPADSLPALVTWLRSVAEDGADLVLIDRGSGPLLATTAALDAPADLGAFLPGMDDVGAGAVVTADGPTAAGAFADFATGEPIRTYERTFEAEQVVFPLGSSQLIMLEVTAQEYASHVEAAKGQQVFSLIDIGRFFRLFFEASGFEQMTIGDVRTVELPTVSGSVSAWIMEMVMPVAKFDMAIVMLATGRVAIGVMAIGASGMAPADLDTLVGRVDRRVRADPRYAADLDPSSLAEQATEQVRGMEVAAVTGGVTLDAILPSAEAFPGAVGGNEEVAELNGRPTYVREIEGRGFTFPLGGSDAISLSLTATLHPQAADALKTVLWQERQSPQRTVNHALAAWELGAEFFEGEQSSYERSRTSRIGHRSAGAVGRIRAALRLDADVHAFATGRVSVLLVATAAPGTLDETALLPVAEEIHRRILTIAPDVVGEPPDEALIAAISRVIDVEQAVDSLVEAREFPAAFEMIDAAALADSPVGFEAETWNGLCWYASLYGHAERAMPACEAAVAPDTTDLNRRDSRGLARALVGDTDGAIADFRYVVDNAADGAFTDRRAGWLEALLAGENPFTEAVLEDLRHP